MAAPGGKLAASLHYALERVSETTAFVFHQVDPEFSPYGNFSSVTLKLKVHTDLEKRCKLAMPFDDLFKVACEATNPELDKARKFIHRCKRICWPPFHSNPKHKDSENSVMLEIASQILVHLCPEVKMEKRYKSLIAVNPALSQTLMTSPLGLGSINIWHGTPDIRTRGGVLLCQGEEGEEEFNYRSGSEGDEEDSSGGEHSDGMTVHNEGKILANLQQVVPTCVVSSFTESKRHPGMSALIPTILIDKKLFIVCLYDCKKDVLLISNRRSLCTKNHLSQSGIALLWTVLNHR
jgi:hypothetical protein